MKVNHLELAMKFCKVLQHWMTEEQIAKAVAANKIGSPTVCHTHDYCDANQAMLDAFESFGVEFNVSNKSHQEIFSQAWFLAKKAGFSEQNLVKQAVDDSLDQMSEGATIIFDMVKDAMQEAEEIGGVKDHDDYMKLMAAISSEALWRIFAAMAHNKNVIQ